MTTLTDKAHVLTLGPSAVETLAHMKEQAVAIHESWHRHRPEWASAGPLTLSRQLVDMMGVGLGHDTQVYKDGSLSLLVRTEAGIVYGMIFHPKVYRVPAPLEDDIRVGIAAPRMGRFCMAHKVQTTTAGHGPSNVQYCTEPYDPDGPTCTCETPVPVAMPVPGEWSFHS